MKDKEQWEGGTFETEEIILVDEPDGRPIILRTLLAKFKPDLEQLPSEKVIADDHVAFVNALLWKDELVLIKELHVTINAVERTYMVHATCQPRKGSALLAKPKTLEDVIGKREDAT